MFRTEEERGRRERWTEAGQERKEDRREKPDKKAEHEEKTDTRNAAPADRAGGRLVNSRRAPRLRRTPF